ncbi:MAG: DUF255 domain-containing protein [Phycisphaerales bacterium]
MSAAHDRTPSSGHPANRLAGSSSPYLLQHAHNPVDWYPWGEEAFGEARRRGVPIFLSIGYSTCYWCHVMERESFEDAATARLMNGRMVCVKLDREERPDLDDIYMAATVAMTGQGGWPMSVFLEPDTLRPFFCGTYYPREPMHGRPTFQRVVEGITDAFHAQREDVRAQAARLAGAVGEQLADERARVALGMGTIEDALSRVLALFDPVHGGFGSAPKFPQCVFLEFLLDVRGIADGETRAAVDRCVKTTLDGMAAGGIHDHVGGGFHRYSVDASWTVPHFEKMLYDQAQMVSVYQRASRELGEPWYHRVALRAASFVGQELTDPAGGLWSAVDAEVEGREGLNYLWTPGQVRAVAPEPEASLMIRAFSLDQPPNFRDPHHPDDAPSWVLRMPGTPLVVSSREGMAEGEWGSALMGAVAGYLVDARRARPSPRVDTKVLASWNGMAFSALALLEGRAGGAGAPGSDLLARFSRALDRLTTPAHGLLRAPGVPAFLEDYGAMASACVAVARASAAAPAQVRAALLDRARAFIEHAVRGCTEGSGDGVRIFDAPSSPDLFVRACSTHDGAMPSGYSLFLHGLLDVAEESSAEEAGRLRGVAASLLSAMSGRIAESPVGSINSVRALLRLVRAAPELAASLADVAPGGGLPASLRVVSSATAVEVLATEERIVLAEDAPAQFTLRVRIRPGFHVIAADPGGGGPASLVPFRVGVFHGSGVVAYADYPQGSPLSGYGNAGAYEGEFDLPVALERSGAWSGTPLLMVTFQACSDTECLAPARVELDIALDRG